MGIDPEKEKKARQVFERTAENMNEHGVRDAAKQGARKLSDLDGQVPQVLRDLWNDVKTLVDLVNDWACGSYTQAPWTTIAAVASAVAYFACPFDVLPDIIPILGYLDDVIVIKVCLDLVERDLAAYRQWRTSSHS